VISSNLRFFADKRSEKLERTLLRNKRASCNGAASKVQHENLSPDPADWCSFYGYPLHADSGKTSRTGIAVSKLPNRQATRRRFTVSPVAEQLSR
jgi:hypothetical protein